MYTWQQAVISRHGHPSDFQLFSQFVNLFVYRVIPMLYNYFMIKIILSFNQ